MIKLLIIAALLFPFQNEMSAKNLLTIPSIFSDNMVLQQNTKVSFWGYSNPNAEVTIDANWGASEKTVASENGFWFTKIQTTKAGGPYEVQINSGDSLIVFKNVMLGEVWLCSGQSNMEMPLLGFPPQDTIWNSKEEIKNANYPDIRLFTGEPPGF